MAEGDVALVEKLHQQLVELVPVVEALAPADHAAMVGELQRCVNTLAELHRRSVAAAARSEVWALDGFRSPAPWIACHTGLGPGRARRLHHAATTMATLRHARDAALAGVLHDRHVEGIVRCARRSPDRYDDATDEAFTSVAASGDGDAFATVVRDWLASADAVDSPDPAGLVPEAAGESVSLHQTLDGWWDGTVRLSAANGALLSAALDRGVAGYLRAQRDGDPTVEPLRPPALRAQALMDLVDAAGRHDPHGAAGPDRFHVGLTMRMDADGHVAPVEPAMPGATCDGSLFRIVMGAAGEPLDIGRRTRSWPTPVRTAIIRRDRHCRFPGCQAPPGHCDVHHCTPWEHGGSTAIDNGVLLCRWHHTFLHTQHWTVELDQRQHPTFRRRDGTPHQLQSMRPGAP